MPTIAEVMIHPLLLLPLMLFRFQVTGFKGTGYSRDSKLASVFVGLSYYGSQSIKFNVQNSKFRVQGLGGLTSCFQFSVFLVFSFLFFFIVNQLFFN